MVEQGSNRKEDLPMPADAKRDVEVPARSQRRRFTAEYKLRILAEADRCEESGDLGALLRREGLYSSHLTKWRQQRDEGTKAALGQKRGRKLGDPLIGEVNRLRQENARLNADLARAKQVIEVQGKVSALFRELSLGSAQEMPIP